MRNLNLVHLNGLRAAEAVARLGGLAAAAAELGVSPGAVSQQVTRIEAELGTALFDRTGKGLVPLARSTAFLARLNESFSLLSQAVGEIRHRDDLVLTISVAPILASRWLVHRLPAFAARHPDIRLRIEADDRFIPMGSGDVDIALRVGRGGWSDAEAEKLLDELVFPVCAPVLADRLKVPADIVGLPIVVDGPSVFGWDIWLEPAGLGGTTLDIRHVFSDGSLALDAAIGGQGVFLAWETLAAFALEHGRLVEPFDLRVPTGRATWFVTPKGRRPTAAVQAFRAWVREELKASG
ncbi:LysR substrate-binding domain-containing protein [Rhizobium sp. C1]|uniref:LysR substrate-binding domain-containing protein n=1 Tax=Rhizobium sp. C1 TaxID=1349799 RepID=UPI001E31A4D9|nr:LysR substrate-binding domain-containing protein [Rhizobium sp. C1]MCD2177425.1 LysR substrate-binding domain-containing protein [Rhizobium sp. C1]